MSNATLPKAYQRFAQEQPEIMDSYEHLGEAVMTTGPLDRKTAELVKLGIAVGSRQEGAVHAHVRRARDAGASVEEIRHAVRLSLTTLGFPGMMAALTWTDDVQPADAT
jgi:AhpD family alkylhydroperoxidase